MNIFCICLISLYLDWAHQKLACMDVTMLRVFFCKEPQRLPCPKKCLNIWGNTEFWAVI